MAKLKTLKGAPKDFTLPVPVYGLDGAEVEVEFQCIGRTLRDWQPLYLKRLAAEANANIDAQAELDKKAEQASADEKPAKGKAKPGVKKIEFKEDEIRNSLDSSLTRAVELVREVATGWDLEDDFTDDNIKELISRFPGTQVRLHQLYNDRVLGNRAKN